MAANDANIATIRKRHEVYPYLSIAPEAEVLRGTISGTYGDQVTSVTYSNVSGSYTNVAEDMEVEIFTSGGVSKGRVRVAPGGATSTVVQIEEVSPGRTEIVSGDQIRVYRSWRTRSRLVAATEDFDRDSRVAYTDQTDDYAPVAIIGGGKAGFINPSTSVLTVSLDASASYTVDPDSGGTLTYLWDVDDGTITVGTSTDASITATFPAGARWISLTVTDSSNSKTFTQYAPIWAHEKTGSNAPIRIANVQVSATAEEMWVANFDLVDEQDETAIPNGALCAIWKQSLYDGTEVAYGSDVADRSMMEFVGYLARNVESADGEDNGEGQARSTFTALSPLAVLAREIGFSQVIERVASSPQSWFEATGLSVKRALDYLIRWGTTFMRVHDFLISNDLDDKDYPAFILQENTPLAQLRELAVDALDGQLICTRGGRIWVQPDLLVSDSTARNAAATQLTIGNADYISVQYDTEHRYQYAQVELRAITPGLDINLQDSVFVVAPGLAPVEGAPQRTVYDRRIATTSEAKDRVGWIFARDNSVKNGVPVRSNILLKLWIGYDVFDFFAEWVVLNIAPSLLHGNGFSSARCVIRAISVTYTNDGGGEVLLTLQEETDAPAGAILPQVQPDINNDDFTPIFEDYPWLFDVITIDPTPDNIIKTQPVDPRYIFAVGSNVNNDDDEVALGEIDWETSPASVTWINTVSGVTGLTLWARGDPFNPNRKYIGSSDGIWVVDNIFTSSTATLVGDLEDIFGASATTWPAYFEMSNNRKGYMVVMAGGSTVYPYSGAFSTNYGATWTQFNTTGSATDFSDAGGMLVRDVKVSPYNNPNAAGQGWLYSIYRSATNDFSIQRSTDWGATWATLFTFTKTGLLSREDHRIFIPYTRSGGVANKNDASQLLHFVIGNNGSTWGSFTAGGTTNINSAVSTCFPLGTSELLPLNALTQNGAYVYMVTHRSTSGVGVMRSVDSGASFLLGDNCPNTGTYKVGSEANGSPFCTGLNGWGTEGTLVHFCVGVGTGNALTAAYPNTGNAGAGSVVTAYTALGATPVQGFLRIKRGTDAEFSYVATPDFYKHKVAYAEFQLET